MYINQVEHNLTQNIDTFSIGLSNLNNIDKKVKLLKEKTKLRITIIAKNGTVIAESDKDKTKMSNHSNRYEIIHAKYEGEGTNIRTSKSVNKKLIYVAKRFEINNKIYFIRMADYIDRINEHFLMLTLKLIPLYILFLIVAIIASYMISKRIKKETDNILNFLSQLSNKEDPSYIKSDYTQEFHKISKLLKKVALKLRKKDKLKAKHTAKLKLANKQKDEIISAISHEFKNPIAIISGYSETILNDDDIPNSMKKNFLNKIYQSSNKLSSIIDRLRLALKLDEGKEEINFQNLSLNKLCQNIKEELEINYKEREIKIIGIEKFIQADETLINIAISNIIENALKYSEDDVIIEIKENSLQVIDKGIGIEENEVNNITKKFYRVSKNGWNNSMGLGLNIVLNILTLHHFTLDIKSELHKGSCFIIKF